jgi:hypothetical protein
MLRVLAAALLVAVALLILLYARPHADGTSPEAEPMNAWVAGGAA